MTRRLISAAIYLLSGALGIMAFVYPFFLPVAAADRALAHSQDAPLLTAALVGLSVVALLVELQGRSLSAKTVAMLGVLVAVTSVLRFLEVAFPMPGGFSPIFAPIMIAGYVFGARFGFLMGTFTLLASALITGGVGPWLPYQMFTAGWAGLTAGWLRRLEDAAHRRRSGRSPGLAAATAVRTAPNTRHDLAAGSVSADFRQPVGRWSIVTLSIFGFIWGLLYGAIVNVYFWPFAGGPVAQTWAPGIGLVETLSRYAAFYVLTSLAWDMARAVGNVALILLLGAPMIKALERFRLRFNFEVRTIRETTGSSQVEVRPHA